MDEYDYESYVETVHRKELLSLPQPCELFTTARIKKKPRAGRLTFYNQLLRCHKGLRLTGNTALAKRRSKIFTSSKYFVVLFYGRLIRCEL